MTKNNELLKQELLKMRQSIDNHIADIDTGLNSNYVTAADLSCNLTQIIFICNTIAFDSGKKAVKKDKER